MGTNYPTKINHTWTDLVVGGADLEPLVSKLEGNNLISNSDFEDAKTGWGGTFDVLDEGLSAFNGSYVASLDVSGVALTRTIESDQISDYILLTGKVKFPNLIDEAPICEIEILNTNTSETITLSILGGDDVINRQWIPFYLLVENSTFDVSANLSISVDANGASNTQAACYVDDIMSFRVKELINLATPCGILMDWDKVDDSNYEMVDGTSKNYIKGWRPTLSIQYGFMTPESLAEVIGISEESELFVAPNKDSTFGLYCRWDKGLSYDYFKSKMIGHENNISLKGIYVSRNKNREYGNSYYTCVTT